MIIVGVYMIKNIVTGNCYIGSSVNIVERWKRHRKDLRKNGHHSRYLQRSFNKHGEKAFVFGVIQECGKEKLADIENANFRSYRPMYNMCLTAFSTVGRIVSQSTKDKHRKYAIDNNIRPPVPIRKAVQKLDYNTLEVLEEYSSISDACFAVGRNYSFVTTIKDVCNGKRNSAFGFKWKLAQ
jgi:group I intron endonuclease